MSRERQLPENWIRYFGPVVMAQFIQVGWIKEWPLTLTAEGQHAVQGIGYGVLRAGDRKLPQPVTLTGGTESWDGRKAGGGSG